MDRVKEEKGFNLKYCATAEASENRKTKYFETKKLRLIDFKIPVW